MFGKFRKIRLTASNGGPVGPRKGTRGPSVQLSVRVDLKSSGELSVRLDLRSRLELKSSGELKSRIEFNVRLI